MTFNNIPNIKAMTDPTYIYCNVSIILINLGLA